MIEDGHFTYWNRQSLTRLLEAVGLEVTRVGFFGLGRDLVAPLDRLRPSRLGAIPATGGAPGAGSSWDTRAPVLLAERAANLLLDRTRLGVGIMVEARRRSATSGRSTYPVADTDEVGHLQSLARDGVERKDDGSLARSS
jgi:hypothetical protein